MRKILGEQEAKEILTPLFYVSKTGKDIPQSWNLEFLMKAYHSSGGNMLVKPRKDLSAEEQVFAQLDHQDVDQEDQSKSKA